MDFIRDIYQENPSFWNFAILILVFGGMLAVGLALLLTIALITWADDHAYTIKKIGPWAAFVLIQAILIMISSTRRKAKDI